MKVLSHIAVFLERKLVTAEKNCALGRKSSLAVFAFVTGGDGVNSYPVAFFKTFDLASEFVNNPDGFMPQDAALEFSE
jgi:hypothetical protein